MPLSDNFLSRRRFLQLAVGGAAVVSAGGCVSFGKSQRRPLNVLMIAIDDMNNWPSSFWGNAKTPNIDRLAAQGVKFTNAHCVVSACNPSRVALLAGMRPETTGQFGNDGNFRLRPGGDDIVTLPQHFRQHGYEAVAAGKLFHQQRGGNEEPDPVSDPQSWDRQYKGWIGTPGRERYLNKDGYGKWHDGKFKEYLGKYGVWGPIDESKEECGDWKAADFCARYLAEERDKPFFLACGIFRPHSPQLAPQEFFDMYPLDEIELPEAPDDDFDDIPKCAHENFTTDFFVNGVRAMGQWKKAVQAYLASMSFADACVGHLLNALENSEYRDNTAVLLWSDHGWHLGDKHRWEKYSLWSQATNAPTVIKIPGVTPRGEECGRAVSYLDFYPTLSEVCGLPLRDELEGHSLAPLLRDPSAVWPWAAVNTDHYNQDYSVTKDQWNYIRYESGEEELYDHSTDRLEFQNLASDPQYEDLKKGLAEFIPTPQSHPNWRTHDEERARQRKEETNL